MTEIRLAADAEISQVAKIMTDGWRTTYAGIFPDEYLAGLTYEAVTKKWKKFLFNPRHFILVAAEGDKVLAFIAGNSDFPERDCGFIESFHSLPEARGKGLGRKLVEAAHEQFQRDGKVHAMVYAIAENARARAIYTHLGGGSGRVFYRSFRRDHHKFRKASLEAVK